MAAPTPEELNLYLSQIEPIVSKILAHKSAGKSADLPENAVFDISTQTLNTARHIRRVAIRQRLQLAAFAKRLTLEQINIWQAVHGSPRKQAEAMNQIMAENQATVARFLTSYTFRTTDQRDDVLNESFRTFFEMINNDKPVIALISTVVKGIARYKALKALGSDRKNSWEWLEIVYESSGDEEIGTFDYPLPPDERLAPENVDLRLLVKPDKKKSKQDEPDDADSEEIILGDVESGEEDSQREDEFADTDFSAIAFNDEEPDEAEPQPDEQPDEQPEDDSTLVNSTEEPDEAEPEGADANDSSTLTDPKDEPKTVHIRLNFRKLQVALADCLERLMEPRRSLIRLKYAFWKGYENDLISEEQIDSSLDKLNMKEIAELAGYKNAHTASVRLRETRKKLKDCLKSKLNL